MAKPTQAQTEEIQRLNEEIRRLTGEPGLLYSSHPTPSTPRYAHSDGSVSTSPAPAIEKLKARVEYIKEGIAES